MRKSNDNRKLTKRIIRSTFKDLPGDAFKSAKIFKLCCDLAKDHVRAGNFHEADQICNKAKKACQSQKDWEILFLLSAFIFQSKAEKVFQEGENLFIAEEYQAAFKKFQKCLKIFPEPKILIYYHLIKKFFEAGGESNVDEISRKINGTLHKYRNFSFAVPDNRLSKEWTLRIMASVHAIALKFNDEEYCLKVENFLKKHYNPHYLKIKKRRNSSFREFNIWTMLGTLIPIDKKAARITGFKYYS